MAIRIALWLKAKHRATEFLIQSVQLKIGEGLVIYKCLLFFSILKQAKNSSTTLFLVETLNGIPADVASIDIQNWFSHNMN